MGSSGARPPGGTAGRADGRRRLTVLALVLTALSLGHHADHLARGNHLGWPLTPEVTPFTYSFVVYPLIGLGFWLWTTGRAGPGYWALLTAAGLVFVGLAHLGPLAVEPPPDIIEAYASRAVGLAAFGLLLVFLAALAVTALVATRLWWRERGGEG